MPVKLVSSQDFTKSIPVTLASTQVIQEELITVYMEPHDAEVFQVTECRQAPERVKILLDAIPQKPESFVRVATYSFFLEVLLLSFPPYGFKVSCSAFNDVLLVIPPVRIEL